MTTQGEASFERDTTHFVMTWPRQQLHSNRKQKAKDAAEKDAELQKKAKRAARTNRRAAVARGVRAKEASVERGLEELRPWRRSELGKKQRGTNTVSGAARAGGATSPELLLLRCIKR